jgi:lipid-A-disaccharide synthase
MDKLGVRGYAEVLKQYREIRQVQKDLIRRFLDDPPALFIGIDSSDFNLDIERKLKARASGSSTTSARRSGPGAGGASSGSPRSVSHILALFPFEPELYQKAGVPVTYVGHPLADMIPMEPDRARRGIRCGCRCRSRSSRCCPGAARPSCTTWRTCSSRPRRR